MKIVIIGCGGHAREMAQIVDKVCSSGNDMSLIGFADDNPELHGKSILNLPVLGGNDWIAKHHKKYVFLCAIGSSVDRRDVVKRLDQIGVKWATLIDPDVLLSKDASVGEGAMICADTRMTTNVRFGRHSIVNMGCTLSHDVVVGDFATLGCGVHLSGNVTIGEGAELGVGANVIPGISIGEWSIIGAGSTVISDIPPHVTAVGVPARVIKKHG
jgi:sugar O-acyltransferase (sialic acid O-acetyltransferase NeuD family)